MTTKLLIDRELLEQVASEFEHDNDRYMLGRELRKVLDTPRQPEGDGLEVVAWQDADNPLYTTAEKRLLHDWANNGYPIVELCRLSDAQRAIAELREECKIHRNSAAGAHNQLRANRLETERLAVDWQAAVAERDTLRQQLAELRAQLLAIASAEPRRHTIEWAKAMAATGNNEAYAKWREAFDQRDKLAGLLADVKADYTHAIHWEDMHATMKRIDAALAEVKPCLESPAPTT